MLITPQKISVTAIKAQNSIFDNEFCNKKVSKMQISAKNFFSASNGTQFQKKFAG